MTMNKLRRPSHLTSFRRTITRAMFSSPESTKPARPQWLEDIISDRSPPPQLYAWSSTDFPAQYPKQQHLSRRPTSQSEDRRRIHILGIGNLGRLFATSLARLPDPPPITLVVHKKELLDRWMADQGIEITRSGSTERLVDFDVEWWTEEKPRAGPVIEVAGGNHISNLIVATKAPDALLQVDRLRRYLGATSTVAFVQNGMNRFWPPLGAAYDAARYPAEDHPSRVVCVATHGVTSLGTFKSLHASPANVAVGPVRLNDRHREVAEYLVGQILAAPYLDAHRVSRPDLWVLQLEKLVVNSVINPLSAILRCKNGVLFSDPQGPIVRIMDLLVDQASAVLQALVLDSSSRDVLLDEAFEPGSDAQRTLETRQAALLDRFSPSRLRAMLHSVGEKVKDNKSSMLQDVTARKPTEIREFNGWLVDTAAYLDAGLDVSFHEKLIELVERGAVMDESRLEACFLGAPGSLSMSE